MLLFFKRIIYKIWTLISLKKFDSFPFFTFASHPIKRALRSNRCRLQFVKGALFSPNISTNFVRMAWFRFLYLQNSVWREILLMIILLLICLSKSYLTPFEWFDTLISQIYSIIYIFRTNWITIIGNWKLFADYNFSIHIFLNLTTENSFLHN